MNNLPYTIDDLRVSCRTGKIKWSLHAVKRLRERNIKTSDYKNCILTGEIIEEYPKDNIMPSCLVLGMNTSNRHIHSVAGYSDEYLYAITAYFPNKLKWEDDLKTRKR